MAAEPSTGPGGFFGATGQTTNKYPNPFYSVSQQYLPIDITNQLWWADHFLLRFGFYRTAASRVANYFITQLNIECENDKDKKVYEDAFENGLWKEQLWMAGFNLIAYGNTYSSITPGFKRFLSCPKCSKTTAIEDIDDYTFDSKGKFHWSCKKCRHTGVFDVNDRTSRNPDDINIVFWPPKEVHVRHEQTTNDAEYYWEYTQDYAATVTKEHNKATSNQFYSKVVPMPIYEAIFAKKLISFNSKNFLHLRLPAPAGIKTQGRGIPPCIYMFDDFFLLQILRRYNEAICFEDINPFRVISMGTQTNSQANPILNQDSNVWMAKAQDMIEKHRRDPGSYGMFPFPMEYQQLGGQGKQLAPIDLMDHVAANILNTLNVPQELFNMQLKLEAVGPALRLFENSWSVLPDNYNRFLQQWADVIANMRGITPAKVSLIPTTLADDMEKKSVIGQLVGANAVAKSTLLGLYGLDFRGEIVKKLQEDRDASELQKEEQLKQQAGSVDAPQQQQDTQPQDVQSQAQEQAKRLFPMDGGQRRTELQKIKQQGGETLWSHTKTELEKLTQSQQSQGVQQGKQQAQQQ